MKNNLGTDVKRGVTLAAGPSIVDIGGPRIGLGGGIGGLGQERNRDSALFGSGVGSQEPVKRGGLARNDGAVNVEASADFGGLGKSPLVPAQDGLRGSQGSYLPRVGGIQDSVESKKPEAAPDAPAGDNKKFTSKPSFVMINRSKDTALTAVGSVDSAAALRNSNQDNAPGALKKPTVTKPFIGGKKPEKASYKPTELGGGLGGSIGGGYGGGIGGGVGAPLGALGGSGLGPLGAPKEPSRLMGKGDGARGSESEPNKTVAEEELEDENSLKDGSYMGRRSGKAD